MKRTIRITLCGVLLCLLSVMTVGAVEVDLSPTERFFVNDYADALSSQDEDAIYAMGVQLYQKTGAQVVAVAVPTLDDADIDEYGVALGRAWGIGDEEKNTGILLILATEDREVGISVGYGLEGAVTDAKSGMLLDNYALPYFAEDDFSTGMRETYKALVNEVYIEFGMEPEEGYVPVEELSDDVPGSVGIIILVVTIVFLLIFGRGRLPFFLFFGGGHHRGNYGGFGGHSGGFSSGGFRGGGGSFGGGGASRRF